MLDALLDSLSVVERGVVKALQLDGALAFLVHDKLVLAYPAFVTDEEQPFYKRYERLPNGQWQQVLCLDAGTYTLCNVTPFDLDV